MLCCILLSFVIDTAKNVSVQVFHEAAISHSQVGIKWLCGLNSWNTWEVCWCLMFKMYLCIALLSVTKLLWTRGLSGISEAVWMLPGLRMQCDNKVPKLEANKVTARKQASAVTEGSHHPPRANWPFWEWVLISPGAAAASSPLQTTGAVWDRQIPAMHRCCHLHWCSLAWLKGTLLQVPTGPGDTEAPQCLPCSSPRDTPWWQGTPAQRDSRAAGRSWADKLHQGCLAWLQPWLQERCGTRQCGRCQQELRARRQQEGAEEGVEAERWQWWSLSLKSKILEAFQRNEIRCWFSRSTWWTLHGLSGFIFSVHQNQENLSMLHWDGVFCSAKICFDKSSDQMEKGRR